MQLLKVSGAVRPLKGSLGVKGLIIIMTSKHFNEYKSQKKNSEILFCSGYLGLDDQNSTLKYPLLYTYHYLI